jgi:phosphohistidine phosphatase
MSVAGAAPACILVRHAHAQWPDYQGQDFSRPLTDRGIAQAHATGLALRTAGLAPRRILASAARRTEQTARILLAELQLPLSSLQLLDSLYNASAAALAAALQAALQQGPPVLLVAHNPGISELARLLSGNPSPASFRPAEWRAFSSAGDTATPHW